MNVGITGGIGSGKSYICNKFRQLGFPVYSCDDEAKHLMVSDIEIIDGIKNLVGGCAYDVAGNLNTKAVADYIFSDSENIGRINAIVHPRVKAHFLSWAKRQNNKTVFMECAILFEAGFNDVVDMTVSVYAPKDIRLLRAMERDHASRIQVLGRMDKQMDDEEKRRLADFVILNDGIEDVDRQIRIFMDSFLGIPEDFPML